MKAKTRHAIDQGIAEMKQREINAGLWCVCGHSSPTHDVGFTCQSAGCKCLSFSPAGDASSADEWRYEFRPDEKYADLGIYTILAPNPDAGKEGVIYSGKEIAMADTDDQEVAAQIVREHNAHRKLVEALREIDKAITSGDLTWKRRRQADSDPYHPATVALCAALALAEVQS